MTRIRSRWLAPLALGALVLGSATVVLAADTPEAPGKPAHHGGWFQRQLGLTDEQVQQIRAIRAEDREAYRRLHGSLRQARAELRRLALDGADDATLTAKRAEVESLIGQSIGLQVESLRKIAPILTPEQREKLAQLRPGGHHRRHRMHQPS